jgi:hypothetical protein
LVLNCDGFGLLQQRQENINVNVVVSQVADVDACGAGLCAVIPKNVTIIWIPGCRSGVSPVKKQI